MLTGLFGASAGTIFVYGKDIKTDLHTVRKNMGVCMQHDVLFSYLTTKEHLLLYGSIKVPHWTKKQLHEEVKRSVIVAMPLKKRSSYGNNAYRKYLVTKQLGFSFSTFLVLCIFYVIITSSQLLY